MAMSGHKGKGFETSRSNFGAGNATIGGQMVTQVKKHDKDQLALIEQDTNDVDSDQNSSRAFQKGDERKTKRNKKKDMKYRLKQMQDAEDKSHGLVPWADVENVDSENEEQSQLANAAEAYIISESSNSMRSPPQTGSFGAANLPPSPRYQQKRVTQKPADMSQMRNEFIDECTNAVQ